MHEYKHSYVGVQYSLCLYVIIGGYDDECDEYSDEYI